MSARIRSVVISRSNGAYR